MENYITVRAITCHARHVPRRSVERASAREKWSPKKQVMWGDPALYTRLSATHMHNVALLLDPLPGSRNALASLHAKYTGKLEMEYKYNVF